MLRPTPPQPAVDAPGGDGATGVVGTSKRFAREDHQHPRPTLNELGAAATSHTHTISDTTGLQALLPTTDEKAGIAGASASTPVVLGNDPRLTDSRDAVSLQGVEVTTDAPSLGDALKFDGTSWRPEAVASGAFDPTAFGSLEGGTLIKSAIHASGAEWRKGIGYPARVITPNPGPWQALDGEKFRLWAGNDGQYADVEVNSGNVADLNNIQPAEIVNIVSSSSTQVVQAQIYGADRVVFHFAGPAAHNPYNYIFVSSIGGTTGLIDSMGFVVGNRRTIGYGSGATSPKITAANLPPYSFAGGETLEIETERGSIVSDPFQPGDTTLEAVIDRLHYTTAFNTGGLRAQDDLSGNLVIERQSGSIGSYVRVTGGSANSVLGFGPDEAQGDGGAYAEQAFGVVDPIAPPGGGGGGGGDGDPWFDLWEIPEPADADTDALRLFVEDQQGVSIFRVKDSTGLVQQMMRDNILVVRNTTGSTLYKGAVVYISGSTGSVPNIALARADSLTTAANGILAEDVSNNGFGRMMILGTLRIDTSAYTDGALLYLSAAAAGTYTTTPPDAPDLRQVVGMVVNAGVGNGRLGVDIGAPRGPLDAAYLTSGTIPQARFPASLDTNARLSVEKAGAVVGSRRAVNFIEGANVTLTVADDPGNERVNVTVAAVGGGGGGGPHEHDAADIVSGVLAVARIPVGTSAGTVAAGDDSRLSDARTPTAHNHAASEVTSGTFDTARIPSLDTAKITTGTFDTARIPSLDTAKITTGTMDVARLPAAGGDGSGTLSSLVINTARGLRETSGPTILTLGSVADGEFLKRAGSTLIGATAGGGGGTSGGAHYARTDMSEGSMYLPLGVGASNTFSSVPHNTLRAVLAYSYRGYTIDALKFYILTSGGPNARAMLYTHSPTRMYPDALFFDSGVFAMGTGPNFAGPDAMGLVIPADTWFWVASNLDAAIGNLRTASGSLNAAFADSTGTVGYYLSQNYLFSNGAPSTYPSGGVPASSSSRVPVPLARFSSVTL